MAYDEILAERFRDAVGPGPVVEKRMMGGLIFMLSGNMLGGVDRDPEGRGRFMFRVGPAGMKDALARPGATQVTMGGKTLGGFVFVAEAEATPVLADWIALARRFVDTLPPK